MYNAIQQQNAPLSKAHHPFIRTSKRMPSMWNGKCDGFSFKLRQWMQMLIMAHEEFPVIHRAAHSMVAIDGAVVSLDGFVHT